METHFPTQPHNDLMKNFHPDKTEVRKLFREIRQLEKTEHLRNMHQRVLKNGMTVGEFSMWYIITNPVLT